MEEQNLGDKKMNNEQEVNEGFSGENLPDDYNPAKGKLKTEIEKDQEGHERVVQRARYTESASNEDQTLSGENASTIENHPEHRDRNYDPAAKNRPQNPENRGNLELDND